MSDVIKSDFEGYGLIFKSLTTNKDIDIEAKGLYAYLSSYAGSTNVAFPGVELICHQLNISEPRFKKYRKQLEQHGYISIKRERTPNGFSKNIYTLHHKSVSVQNLPVRNLTVRNLPEGNIGTKNNSIKNNSIKNNSVNNTQSSNDDLLIKEFNEWWELYDYKKSRKAAFNKFKTSRKKHSYELIIEGTKKYIKANKHNEKKYWKYPVTFFNQETYLDEYEEDKSIGFEL